MGLGTPICTEYVPYANIAKSRILVLGLGLNVLAKCFRSEVFLSSLEVPYVGTTCEMDAFVAQGTMILNCSWDGPCRSNLRLP